MEWAERMTAETERLLSEIRRLEAIGPRLTGSDAYFELIDHIASELKKIGLDVQRDRQAFTRWNVPHERNRLGLRVEEKEVEISSPFPYSGTTGPEGINAELQFVRGFFRNWWKARGKIAVVEVHNVSVPFNLAFKPWDKTVAHGPLKHPIFSSILFGPWLGWARKAGVLAVICVWRGLSAENARNQYLPFWQPRHDLPAVWVAGEAGEDVIAAALKGKRAHLLLNATITPDCAMETVWAVSPGTVKDETVLMVTHSDGTNVVEENGHIALIELARDAASRPHARTFVYVFAARHLRLKGLEKKEQATTFWLKAHPELWAGGEGKARAVAGLVIEHLGARRIGKAVEDRAVSHAATGHIQPEFIYATTPQLHDRALKEWSGKKPINDRIFAPRPRVHVGEGEPLYQRNIPAISLATGPQYLLVQGAERLPAEGASGLVDIDLMEDQINFFLRLQAYLDTAPRASIGEVRQPSLRERVVEYVRMLWRFVVIILRVTVNARCD
jgi:hypothetical protein